MIQLNFLNAVVEDNGNGLRVNVLVGKNVSKKYAVSSLYSTLKAMAL